MTHKGGKATKKAFKKAKNVPAKLKEQVEDLKPHQLLSLLRFLLVYLQSVKGSKSLSKAQRRSLAITETQLGVRSKGSQSHSKKKKGHRKLSPGIHTVRVGHAMRKVKVLANGKWQFMKMK